MDLSTFKNDEEIVQYLEAQLDKINDQTRTLQLPADTKLAVTTGCSHFTGSGKAG